MNPDSTVTILLKINSSQFEQNKLKLQQIAQILEDSTMRTIFDLHTDKNGNATPIASMSDDHLRNTIHYYVSQMVSVSLVLNFSTDNLNGVSRAMLGNLQQNVVDEAKKTLKNAQLQVFPYFFEYFGVRGRMDNEITQQIQRAFGRKSGLIMYSNIPEIEAAIDSNDNDYDDDSEY